MGALYNRRSGNQVDRARSTHYSMEFSRLRGKIINEFLYRSYSRTVKNEEFYFVLGVGFATIGSQFSARLHRRPAVFGSMGASVFPPDRSLSRFAIELNSKCLHCPVTQSGDALHKQRREPASSLAISRRSHCHAHIGENLSRTRKSSRRLSRVSEPGPSCWEHAQSWAQIAVDRTHDSPLAAYQPQYKSETVRTI